MKNLVKRSKQLFIAMLQTAGSGLYVSALILVLWLTSCRTTSEYQMNIDMTGYDIYSDGKFLGRLPYGENRTLDSLIISDNE